MFFVCFLRVFLGVCAPMICAKNRVGYWVMCAWVCESFCVSVCFVGMMRVCFFVFVFGVADVCSF